MGRLALLPVNSDLFPIPVLTELSEEPFLGVEGVTLHLRGV
jgi:hypothetical protein